MEIHRDIRPITCLKTKTAAVLAQVNARRDLAAIVDHIADRRA